MAIERAPEQVGVDDALLQLLAQQGRRVPYPVGLSAVVIALMAGDKVSPWFSGLWVALVFAVLALRWWALGRLPRLDDVPVRRRLQWAVALSALNGVVFSASLAFAPYLSDYQRMVQTIVLLGLCAGSVATTAGYLPVLLVFIGPVTLANALAWVSGGGGVHAVTWIELVLGALILGFGWILVSLARDAYRVFVESVTIRAQQLKSNQQLRLALQQAESAIRAKTRFFASASHDLRQPMHTLSLFGAALTMRPLDAASADIAKHMNTALRSLASQMDALLDISKLDAQVVQVTNEVFSLSSWLARLQQEFAPAATRKGLSLSLDCPGGAYVESDPMLLERVVRNLIDNAIKYTQAGGVRITAERQGELWRVAVHDSGAGIAEAEMAHIFEEFYQVGNPERDRAKGLGLGLSIVSRLVDLLDLHLAVDSKLGVGSCFSLSIAAAESQAMPAAPEAAAQCLLNLRVLVIDDEEPVRLAMQTLLAGYGCEVVLAGSTREAMVKSLSNPPDLLLADLRLRGGDDGIAAARSLRSAVPGLPAILISGDTAPERLREAHEAGLTLLHKPVSAEQLVTAIEAAMAERGRGRDAAAQARGAASPAT
ncbi:hybrid sensor histidine kinase/response regulator [Paucibacter sp. M5-1]|uniref:hybrid sensor histidine kinase/response regulator n=1 Tax=Paucibacter sp. M5-1 TaxID=3015998 RepID=UPI0022B8A6D3|nr:ATP-binding protein [Paucibacter sp. M5-1]MCZ7880403.1 ATP-binding protein [Paucibacter sp. M5-1]